MSRYNSRSDELMSQIEDLVPELIRAVKEESGESSVQWEVSYYGPETGKPILISIWESEEGDQ